MHSLMLPGQTLWQARCVVTSLCSGLPSGFVTKKWQNVMFCRPTGSRLLKLKQLVSLQLDVTLHVTRWPLQQIAHFQVVCIEGATHRFVFADQSLVDQNIFQKRAASLKWRERHQRFCQRQLTASSWCNRCHTRRSQA